jgi:hypothetical protein
MSEYEKQANDFLKRHGIKFKFTYIDFATYFEGDREQRNIYRLALTRKDSRIRYSTRFGASIHMTQNRIDPTSYDLLTCITKNDPGSFEDFCSEYGYDTDSRSAMRTYHKVKRDWMKVEKFFSQDELNELDKIN